MSALGRILKIVHCDYCGTEVEIRHKERLTNRKNFFCSKTCEGAYKKEHNPNYLPCEVCGRIIYVKPKDQAKFNHITCSYKCMGELRKIIYVGENNPNYGNRGMNNPMSIERRIST